MKKEIITIFAMVCGGYLYQIYFSSTPDYTRPLEMGYWMLLITTIFNIFDKVSSNNKMDKQS